MGIQSTVLSVRGEFIRAFFFSSALKVEVKVSVRESISLVSVTMTLDISRSEVVAYFGLTDVVLSLMDNMADLVSSVTDK